MTTESEKAPGTEMVVFVRDGAQFGYDVRPGFYAKVYEVDLDYLAALGVIEWKPKKQGPPRQSVLVLNKRKKKR